VDQDFAEKIAGHGDGRAVIEVSLEDRSEARCLCQGTTVQ
jgi:hypothetical protein